jgi:hypothetical protein
MTCGYASLIPTGNGISLYYQVGERYLRNAEVRDFRVKKRASGTF